MQIKALALARALEFAHEVGISQSILEGDSEVIMKAFVEEGRSLAPYNLLVQDARIFSRFFTQLLYSHTKREYNKVAHSLTRYNYFGMCSVDGRYSFTTFFCNLG